MKRFEHKRAISFVVLREAIFLTKYSGIKNISLITAINTNASDSDWPGGLTNQMQQRQTLSQNKKSMINRILSFPEMFIIFLETMDNVIHMRC